MYMHVHMCTYVPLRQREEEKREHVSVWVSHTPRDLICQTFFMAQLQPFLHIFNINTFTPSWL